MNIISLFSSSQAFKHFSETELLRVSFLKIRVCGHTDSMWDSQTKIPPLSEIVLVYILLLCEYLNTSAAWRLLCSGGFIGFFFECFSTSHKVASSYCEAGAQ